MLNRTTTIVAGRDVRAGYTIIVDGASKEVAEVVRNTHILGGGGANFRSSPMLQFKYTDGTSQYAHPSARVEVIAATPISEPSSLR